MGNLFKVKSLTTFAEVIIAVLSLSVLLGCVYFLAPGLRVSESKLLSGLSLDGVKIDNVTNTAKLELPSTSLSSKVKSVPLVRISAYAWNAQSGIIVSNGGPLTTSGSLMELNGINLHFKRQDWFSEIKNEQLLFIDEYHRGVDFPKSDKASMGVIIMGDGAPYYISTMQKTLDDKYGKDKYHVEVVGAVGISYGEDKLIGPVSWKTNPKTMLGSIISTVPGDGDWVTTLNYCFANGLKVNPDFTTYDAEAVNFYPSENDDYIKSAEELIKSQKSGFTVELDEVSNGKKTGDKVKRKIDGCATWTPGDKMVFDALSGFTDVASTKEFNNQMPTTLIVVKEWAEKHPKVISGILKASFTASNQMKMYDEWRVKASECVAKTFGMQTPKYWYDMFKGQDGIKDGVKYSVGGSRVFNYSDALQYYGVGGDGISRYKSVYEQVSKYLVELNPFDFNSNVNGVTTYGNAVNLFYLKSIDDVESGVTYTTDYSAEATEVVASGEWYINYSVGSDKILPSSNGDLEKLYNLLIQAENSKIKIEGHTDNSGSYDLNKSLSEKRGNSVVDYLTSRGISYNRIQSVIGVGSDKPIGDNNTAVGKAKNRRVQVTLLK